MSRSRTVLALLLATLIAIVLFVVVRAQRISELPAPQEPQISVTAEASPSAAPSAEPSSLQKTQEASKKLEIPSVREVRAQVAEDPHHTPPALIQFAKDVSDRSQAAKKSPQSAAAFFGTLEDCLQNKGNGESAPVAAQTLCLTIAEEFAQLYPSELADRYTRLQQSVSPETRKIRSALEQLK